MSGCGSSTQRKKIVRQPKTIVRPQSDKTDILSRWTDSYLKNKEVVAQQKALKQKMKAELPTTNIKDMTYDQLAIARKYYDELGYHERAVKCYERMLLISKDAMELNSLRLELADRFFEEGDFEKAGKLYTGFLEFYPGSNKREYVEYKAILAHFYLTLSCDRDQSETKNTLALTQSFLEHESIYTTYAQEVKDIQKKCYAKLTQSEVEICAFHLRHGNPKGAEQRLAYINKHLRHHAPQLEHEILALETNVHTINRTPLLNSEDPLKKDNVILAENTQEDTSKRHMANRF